MKILFTYAFQIIFALILFEGLLRKLYPDFGVKFFLLKDVLIVFLVIFLLKSIKIKRYFFISTVFLLIYLSFLSLLLGKTTLYLYALGFREYFFYLLLLPITYRYFQYNRIDTFLKNTVFLGSIVSILGILQNLGIIDFDFLKLIEHFHQAHNSAYGHFNYTVSLFDIPEKFALLNLALFILVYTNIRLSDKKISKYNYLYLLIFFVGTMISGRRVASAILMFIILIDIIDFRNLVKMGKVILTVIILTTVAYVAVNFIDPVLGKNVFSETVINDSIFYLGWIIRWLEGAVSASDFFTGIFGITSPGSDVIENKKELIPVFLEGFWDKSLFSLGIFGTLLLFCMNIILIVNIYINSLKHRDDYIIIFTKYYMYAVFIWVLKSGNFLVWAPFSCIILGIYFYQLKNHKKAQFLNGING